MVNKGIIKKHVLFLQKGILLCLKKRINKKRKESKKLKKQRDEFAALSIQDQLLMLYDTLINIKKEIKEEINEIRNEIENKIDSFEDKYELKKEFYE